MSLSFNIFRMLIGRLHEFVIFLDRSAAQFGFDMLDALLFFVCGCVAKDEVHIFECLYHDNQYVSSQRLYR